MSRTGEDAYHTGTPGHEDQREDRDQSFVGFSDPPLRGAEAQNSRRGGGKIHRLYGRCLKTCSVEWQKWKSKF